MKPAKNYLWLELILLFVVIPASFVLPYLIWIKIGLGLAGFGYALWWLRNAGLLNIKPKAGLNWAAFAKRTALLMIPIAGLTIAYVLWVDPQALFYVPMNDPRLYVIILFVYTFLSVWPQEVLYRTFFINRYEGLFGNRAVLVGVNAVVFSLAHLFFRNTLVLVLTLIGGVLFALTFLKFRSTTMVSVEHAIYGNWLFTVGMGQMLAFPGMEGPG